MTTPFRTLLLAAATLAAAFAQNSTGTIAGRVRDAQGALVPSAQVTVTNEDTGLTRRVNTSGAGEYSFPALPVGRYTVAVEREGFRSQTTTGVRVEILQVRLVEFQLELGMTSETVSVEARAPLLDTESSQAGQVIKNEQVVRLPLNVRQFMQLAYLTPMVAPAPGDFRSTEINRDVDVPAAAGQRPENNNYQIDGMENRENGRNSFAVSPPVDSVSEFRVQTGTAPAEFGRGGAIIINVATRSGTNQYHGSVYEFLRNNMFDSRPYFSSRKNPLKRNQFGAALGGPVKKNRLLFFGNYEGFREAATGNPPVGRVITPVERGGVFGSAIVDPLAGGAAFPANTIPQTRFDPISRYILGLVPQPNNADPARNFIYNDVPPARGVRDNVVGRVDYNASQKDIVYGRYLFNKERQASPPNLPPPANSGGSDLSLLSQSVSLHWNRVIRPTLLNVASIGFSRYSNRRGTANSFRQNLLTPSGIRNTLADTDPLFWAAPTVSIPGYLMTSEISPVFRTNNNYQIQESMIWNRGSHTFKFGGDLRDIRTFMFNTGGNGGSTFANAYSRNNVADFLLGLPSTVNKTARATLWNSRVQYYGLYFQDDWKITPKLTLNLGVRYEYETVVRQSGDNGLGWDTQRGEMLLYKNVALRTEIESFYRNIRPGIKVRFVDQRAPYDSDRNNFGPRIGFAYQASPTTVLRSGYGLFYSTPELQGMVSSNDFAPNTLRPSWTADPRVPNLTYNPEGNVSAELTLARAPLTIFPFISRQFPYGQTHQWNFSLQKQLGRSFTMEALYQGAAGVRLVVFDQINNRPPGPGNVQQLLPYPELARIQNFDMWGQSSFHGAAVKVEQRPWHGLSYTATYTFSKSIDNSSARNEGRAWTDPANRRNGRGPSNFDARNRFVAAFEYTLPMGPGQRLFGGLGPRAGRLVSGWGVRGITTMQTGLPQSPSMNLARLGTCATACTARPDRIADGNLPKDVRTLDRFYDAAAFRLLAAGGAESRIGNAGRNILVAPGVNNWDLSVFKDTPIRESHRLEFRWEMFNAWNHTQWGPANTNAEAPTQFGRILSTRPPRIMQFVLRYAF